MNRWQDRPHAPAPGARLCDAAQVPVGGALGVELGQGLRAFRLVLARCEAGWRAYVNECPHFRVRLEAEPGRFCTYEIDGRLDLMCAHHTAMFHLSDGACYDGPCAGGRLEAVPVVERDGLLCVGPAAEHEPPHP